MDHCNLNCKCCNHFSPIATPFFLKLEDFEKDMARIAVLTEGNIGRIWLIGGEPLLHPDIVAFLYSARKFFPDTHITLDTNGTLLLKPVSYTHLDVYKRQLLKRAKALGDYLIVGVTTEQYDESRGKLNIVDSLDKRIENVRQTGFADEIIVEDHPGQKVEDVQKYGIDIFTVGSDWTGAFDHMKQFCEVVYLERTKNISSTQVRNASHPIIRIGVVGTGRIAVRFVPEAKYVSGVMVNSVYNPKIESAKEFGDQFELDLATDDFNAFMKEVDAIYIASPHQTHYEYAKRALEQGKHVLCEKPLAFKRAEAEELFAIAREHGVVLLEAIKTRCV